MKQNSSSILDIFSKSRHGKQILRRITHGKKKFLSLEDKKKSQQLFFCLPFLLNRCIWQVGKCLKWVTLKKTGIKENDALIMTRQKSLNQMMRRQGCHTLLKEECGLQELFFFLWDIFMPLVSPLKWIK